MTDREAFDAFIKDSECIHVPSALAAWQAATTAERERAARVCEAHTVDDVLAGVGIAKSCADMIRSGE